jgi:four helix bundle protein
MSPRRAFVDQCHLILYANRYKVFLNKLADIDGEVAETQVWLQLACDCGYLSPIRRQELIEGYKEVGRILGVMMANPSKFS